MIEPRRCPTCGRCVMPELDRRGEPERRALLAELVELVRSVVEDHERATRW